MSKSPHASAFTKDNWVTGLVRHVNARCVLTLARTHEGKVSKMGMHDGHLGWKRVVTWNVSIIQARFGLYIYTWAHLEK